MTCPQYDFHIHTKYLGCANATMEIPAIIQECERLGMTCVGITDHLNTLDKVELHVPIREDLEKVDIEMEVYLGVELNFTGYDKSFAFNPEIKEHYGFQFAIGGIHSSYLESLGNCIFRRMYGLQHKSLLDVGRWSTNGLASCGKLVSAV